MTLLFLLFVVVAMPWLSYVSYKNIHALEAAQPNMRLSKKSIYLQSIGMQLALCIIAFYTARKAEIPIVLLHSFSIKAIAAAVVFLVVALTVSGLAQRNKQQSESTLRHILPENKIDRVYWIIAVLFAAFCEEYIYRGVLYQVLLQQTESNLWLSALLSAIVFAFGHGTQGERAILQIIPFAIGFHLLVYLSGGLMLPMIVHFIYNMSVELLFGEQIRRKE